MKKCLGLNLSILLCVFFTSCATVSSHEERKLNEWEAQGVAVKEKDESTAAVLNVLPGVGDFYNGNVGYGVVNLLFWPASILWAPIGGADGAKEKNYEASRARVSELEKKRDQAKQELEESYALERISKKAYILGSKKLKTMPLAKFDKSVTVDDLIPFELRERVPANTK